MKLQIHQHSLLTRKVFFGHNFQHWSSSLYQLDHLVICISGPLSLQVIFIFKSSDLDHHGTSSLDLDHHSIWIIMRNHDSIWIITGYYHWIWIITRSGSSSLDLDHHSIWIIYSIIPWSRSSLDLDHLWSIIYGSRSSLDLDHLCWIINTESSWVLSHDSSHHRKFYRANPFSCWL